jgi:hypothetical protein
MLKKAVGTSGYCATDSRRTRRNTLNIAAGIPPLISDYTTMSPILCAGRAYHTREIDRVRYLEWATLRRTSRWQMSRIRSRTYMNNFGISLLWVKQCSPGGEISLQSFKRQVHRVASEGSVNLIQKILDRDVFQVRIGDIALAV